MRFFHVNYRTREQRGGRRPRWWQPVNVGFWASGVPRLLWRCWLFGHRPAVFGTDPIAGTPRSFTNRGYRWVACTWCGERGRPQGSLDPENATIGQRYHGPWQPPVVDDNAERALMKALKNLPDEAPFYPPGTIARTATGTLGGQLVIGGGLAGPGFEFKVGNAGSEHTLAARFSLGRAGALYLHTKRTGRWLQRRLNPTGYESKVCSVAMHRGRVAWRWWVDRDTSYGRKRPPGTPSWWRDGDLRYRPPVADWLFGKRIYDVQDVVLDEVEVISGVGAGVFRCVRLHDGDYLVKLKLQQVTTGRPRGRRDVRWEVDWSAQGRGIPTEGPEAGRYWGATVQVCDRAVTRGTWPAEAVAAIALDISQARTREGWEPSGTIPVTHAGAPR